jgi:hypothetical protein
MRLVVIREPNARARSTSLEASPGQASPARGPARTTPDAARADHRARVAHDVAARVHHQRLRRQQLLDLAEQERPLGAAGDQARGGRIQDAGCALDLGDQRGNARLARRAGCAGEGRARRRRPEPPDRDTATVSS